jgi:hypothetical protein
LQVRKTISFALVWVAHEFYLNWLVTERIFAQEGDGSVQAVSRRFIFMEQVAG